MKADRNVCTTTDTTTTTTATTPTTKNTTTTTTTTSAPFILSKANLRDKIPTKGKYVLNDET